jgi:hypothetical protein
MKKVIPLLLAICLFSTNVLAYGPRGHFLVGAIADRRLAKNKPVAKKVKQLLDGLTLAQVASFPDAIKSWDGCRQPPGNAPVTSKKRINDELRAFLNANLCSSHPSHHEFHYTDVPVFGGEDYGDGTVGREEFDIVKMIPFCIRVLKGEEPETNDRAITKTVAVILLAHYMGDIHQPLHVGAEYFNAAGKPFKPSTTNKGFADQGGNKLTLFTLVGGKLKSTKKSLHSYWDGQTVTKAFGVTPDSTVAKLLASQQPANWQLTGDPETWAEQMANDILPLAREAHERLSFDVKSVAGADEIKSGIANEKKKTGGRLYATWSAGVVKKEIQKGGWRLAALLEETLQ